MKAIRFQHIYDVPRPAWLKKTSAQKAAELQTMVEEHRAARQAFAERSAELIGAAPVERDILAIQALGGESVDIGKREMTLRRQIIEWIDQHFTPDRAAEHQRASDELVKVRDGVIAGLCELGYVQGGPEVPNSILPIMLHRNARIQAAFRYEQDVKNATAHRPEHLSAIAELELQIADLTKRAGE